MSEHQNRVLNGERTLLKWPATLLPLDVSGKSEQALRVNYSVELTAHAADRNDAGTHHGDPLWSS